MLISYHNCYTPNVIILQISLIWLQVIGIGIFSCKGNLHQETIEVPCAWKLLEIFSDG